MRLQGDNIALKYFLVILIIRSQNNQQGKTNMVDNEGSKKVMGMLAVIWGMKSSD